MMVGEQPGNDEDLQGRPFVGPAGRVLDAALAEAGIDRRQVYVTNAVKHFKWVERGKRRIHERPSSREVAACRPWLDVEIETVKPQVLVLLGSTAAQALLGSSFRVTQSRGRPLESSLAPTVVATVHPSSILRAPDSEARHLAMAAFVHDLRAAARSRGAEGEPRMSEKTRHEKDGRDPGKKRRRMRDEVRRRHARAAPDRPSRDEGDTVTYKKGSAADRTRRGAP